MHFSTSYVMLDINETKKKYLHFCIIEKKTTEKVFRITKTVTDFNIFTVVLSSVYNF